MEDYQTRVAKRFASRARAASLYGDQGSVAYYFEGTPIVSRTKNVSTTKQYQSGPRKGQYVVSYPPNLTAAALREARGQFKQTPPQERYDLYQKFITDAVPPNSASAEFRGVLPGRFRRYTAMANNINPAGRIAAVADMNRVYLDDIMGVRFNNDAFLQKKDTLYTSRAKAKGQSAREFAAASMDARIIKIVETKAINDALAAQGGDNLAIAKIDASNSRSRAYGKFLTELAKYIVRTYNTKVTSASKYVDENIMKITYGAISARLQDYAQYYYDVANHTLETHAEGYVARKTARRQKSIKYFELEPAKRIITPGTQFLPQGRDEF